MGSPQITTSAALRRTSATENCVRVDKRGHNTCQAVGASAASLGAFRQMTCLPDCSRLLRNCAAFVAFTPAFPGCTHRHCRSRGRVQTGRIRTLRQAGLAAGQTERARSTGSSLCPEASSSGWEGVFCPYASVKDKIIGTRGSNSMSCMCI